MQLTASELSNILFFFVANIRFFEVFPSKCFPPSLSCSQYTLESAYTPISHCSYRMTDWTIKRKESTAP